MLADKPQPERELPPPAPPHSRAVDPALEHIVRLRKALAANGYHAGAATIAGHLARDDGVTKVPAIATIWRILSRRGFVTSQPRNDLAHRENASTPTCPTSRFVGGDG